MHYVVNATFLINTIKTDIRIIESIQLYTIHSVVDEVDIELGFGLTNELELKVLTIKGKKDQIKIPKSKRRLLSFTDLYLLRTAFEHKKSCILVTDDKQLRSNAKNLQIRCYTTPLFIAFMIKNKIISKDNGISFLNDLKEYYIRPKDIETILKHIKKWS